MPGDGTSVEQPGRRRLGVDEARKALPGLVAAAVEGRSTRIGKGRQGVVLAPLAWLGEGYRRLLPALASVPVTAARPKLGELITAAAAGAPQVLTRHGVPAAVLMVELPAPAEPAGPHGALGREQQPPRRLHGPGDAPSTAAALPVSFGLASMSAAAQGLVGGRLVVIAGAPGAGSSLLASTAARTTVLEQGRPVLYAASGLTREDVTARMVAAQAAVDYQQLRAQTLPPAQQAVTREVFARLSQAPLHIDDGADLTAEAIADTAPYIEDLALIVVDRLQHRHAPHLSLSGPALPGAARTLARLAARLRVPVLAALDTDDPDAVAALDPDVTLVLTRHGSEAEVTVAERDFGALSRVRLRADVTRARFTEAGTPAALPGGPVPRLPQPLAPPVEDDLPSSTSPDAAPWKAAAPGQVVRGQSAPCAACGHPTPYRIDGRPLHMKGFCRTPAQTQTQPHPDPASETTPAAPVGASRPGGQPASEAPPGAPAAPAGASRPGAPASETAPAAPAGASRPGAWPAGLQPPTPPLPAACPARGEDTRQAPHGDTGLEADEERPAGRFEYGPFAVLDEHGTAHLHDGTTLPCPAVTIRELAQWAADRPFGTPRLTPHGRDGDPLVVLMPGAAERLGLPATQDPEHRALPVDHPILADLAAHGWQVPQRGGRPWFSAWPRIYQRVERGRRSVQLAVTSWGALSTGGWPLPVDPATKLPTSSVPEVVAFLAAYAQRVRTPVSSTASTGLELMTATRPPTRAWRDADTGTVRSAWVPGALHRPVDAAAPEVPREHPLARGRDHLDPAQTLMEEALQWWRLPTDAERALPYAVALDVNVAFGAAANGLPVGTCAPYTLDQVSFDKKLPGTWLYDLSGVPVDPLLPSPFTPDGTHPTGPAWYETHTIAYATELGFRPGPTQAHVRPDEKQAAALGLAPHPPAEGDTNPPPAFGNGPYLKPWYEHLTRGYLETMAALGVTPGMDPDAFLKAMAKFTDDDFKAEHATDLMVLSAIKSTFKGAIGKLRERPHEIGRRAGDPHAPWPALNRPTWRPDIRAAVISRSRVNLHRKIRATLAATGAAPLAVLTDCVVYASPTPDIRWLCGHKSGFQLGPNPGYVKEEGIQTMQWYLDLAEQAQINPARRIKAGTDAVLTGGE